MNERTFINEGVKESEWDHLVDPVEEKDYDQMIDEAFDWSLKEMRRYSCPIGDFVCLMEPEGYQDVEDATVAFFYDRKSNVALMRRNWRSGELRYDVVTNYDALCLEAKDFVDQMIRNGITLSGYYMVYDAQA